MRHGLQFHPREFDADIVSTFAEARNVLAQKTPEILVTEVRVDDGVAQELLPEDPEGHDYPLVILTERGTEKDAVDLLKGGVLDYIVKSRRKCQEIGDLILRSLQSWHRIRAIKQAEVNLQHTLRLARTIMDSLPDPIGVIDEEGRLVSTNEAWRKNPWNNPLIGSNFDPNDDYCEFCSRLDQEFGQKVARSIRSVVDNHELPEPVDYLVEGEDRCWFSLVVHPCTGTGRARAIVIHKDATDQRRRQLFETNQVVALERIKRLTRREKEVMTNVVCGHPNKEIAEMLNISVKTVEMHRSNLMKKLKIRNVAELVLLGIRAGMHETEELVPT